MAGNDRLLIDCSIAAWHCGWSNKKQTNSNLRQQSFMIEPPVFKSPKSTLYLITFTTVLSNSQTEFQRFRFQIQFLQDIILCQRFSNVQTMCISWQKTEIWDLLRFLFGIGKLFWFCGLFKTPCYVAACCRLPGKPQQLPSNTAEATHMVTAIATTQGPIATAGNCSLIVTVS